MQRPSVPEPETPARSCQRSEGFGFGMGLMVQACELSYSGGRVRRMAGSSFWDTVSKSEKRGTAIVQWYRMLASIHRALGSIPT